MDLVDPGALLQYPQSLDKICEILLIHNESQAFKDLCYAVLKVTGYNKGKDINHRGRLQIRRDGSYSKSFTRRFKKLIRWFVIDMKVGTLFFPFVIPHRPGWQHSFPKDRLEWKSGVAQQERILAGIALLFEFLCSHHAEVDISGSIEQMISWPTTDTHCEQCGGGEFEDGNTIVYCTQCDIGYHQSCHQVPVLPAVEEIWFCRDCQTLKAFYAESEDQMTAKNKANDFKKSNNVTKDLTECTASVDPSLVKHSDEKLTKNRKLNDKKENKKNFDTENTESLNGKLDHARSVRKRGGSPSQERGSKRPFTKISNTLSRGSSALKSAPFTNATRNTTYNLDLPVASDQSRTTAGRITATTTESTLSSPSGSYNTLVDMTYSEPTCPDQLVDSGSDIDTTFQAAQSTTNMSLRPLIYMPLTLLEQSNTCLMTILNNKRKVKRAVELGTINCVEDLYLMCAKRWNIDIDQLSNVFLDLNDGDGSLLEVVKNTEGDFKAFIDWVKGRREPLDDGSKLFIHVELLESGYELE